MNIAEKISETGKYPSRQKAYELWEEGIQTRLSKPYGFPFEHEYRFHTQGVARAAEIIAKHIPEMDSKKAFVLGLLHDYGKRVNERQEARFHGREGYEQMMKMGYPDVARVCLTHTFPNKNFDDEAFSYPRDWIDWTRNVLSTIDYDDYDYLIAFCDKFFEGMSMVSIESRVKGIVERYGLSKKQEEILLKQSLLLKSYFDDKTKCDTYSLLGIKK